MNIKKGQSFTSGVYLLETLTAGMYNNPLMVYREYIQNAVDSIDMTSLNGARNKASIDVRIDPMERSIQVLDTAGGLGAKNAKAYLSTIGGSSKLGLSTRGFRGIGRLGGIAFCDKVTFKTSAPGEKTVSKQVWDCLKLREIIGNSKTVHSLSMNEVLGETVEFTQSHNEKKKNSYFEVLLEGVSSFRNVLMDIQKLRKYLMDVAPLPFNYDEFQHAQEVEDILSKQVPGYRAYSVQLNGETLYKPFTDEIPVSHGGVDQLTAVQSFTIESRCGEVLATGWHAERNKLRGAIKRGDLRSGIKVRSGNMLLGDSYLMDGCFREPRFNHYCVGELHVISDKLVPNGRRDDFVDNDFKAILLNEFERLVGLPMSKKIRQKAKSATGLKQKAKVVEGSRKLNRKATIKEVVQSECRDCDSLSKFLHLLHD